MYRPAQSRTSCTLHSLYADEMLLFFVCQLRATRVNAIEGLASKDPAAGELKTSSINGHQSRARLGYKLLSLFPHSAARFCRRAITAFACPRGMRYAVDHLQTHIAFSRRKVY